MGTHGVRIVDWSNKKQFSNYWEVKIILMGMEGVQGVAGGWAWIDTQGVFGARPPWASLPPMHHHASTPAPSMPLQRHQHQTNNNISTASATIWSKATIITWSTGIYLLPPFKSILPYQKNKIMPGMLYCILYNSIYRWILGKMPKNLISATPAFILHTADATAAQPILASYS